jgi:hypothetical protein
VGEALVSMLDENGSPQIVERAKIVPPHSQVGTITADQREEIIASSIIAGHYEKAIDPESAYEILQAREGEKVQTTGAPLAPPQPDASGGTKPSLLAEALGTVTEAFKPTIGCVVASTIQLQRQWLRVRRVPPAAKIGRQIARGGLGGILGGSSRRR